MPSTTEATTPEVPSGSPAAALPRQRSLVWLTARGFAWSLLGTGVSQILALASTVIVARWLTPVDYAIGGLALASIGLFHVLTTQGFASALVRLRDLTPGICDSVFWPVATVGAVVAVGVIALSPLLAAFYGRPEIATVLPFLAAGLFASSVAAVPNALLQRSMRFRAIGALRVLTTLLAASLGITLAVLGHGHLALVVPGATAVVAGGALSFALAGYRPRLHFRRCEFSRVRCFGLSQLGSSVLLYFSDSADYLILGRFWPAAIFGQYYFSFERARQPFNLVYAQLSDVLFSSLSRVQDRLDKLRNAYLEGTETFCLFIFPLHVLLIGLADVIIPALFTERWIATVPVFRIFAMGAFVRGLCVCAPAMFLALDRAQDNLRFNVFRVVVIVPALIVLASSGADMVLTAGVLLVIWTLQLPFYALRLYRLIELPVGDVACRLGTVVVATVAMGASLAAGRMAISGLVESEWIGALLASLVALIVFVGLTVRRLRATLERLAAIFGRS